MKMRETILAALRRDPELVPKVTDSLRERVGDDDGPIATFVHAAEALEPVLAEALEKKPSKLKKLGLKSAQILAGFAAEDHRSNRRLAAIAAGSTVGIVFVDVAGFTTLTEERGDRVAIDLLTRLSEIVSKKATVHQGELVKQLGDGFLVAYPSAGRAIKGAIALRDGIEQQRKHDPGFDLTVRISVHAGEPLVQADDLLGHDVNLAARLLDHCKPGGIIVSEAAKELADRRLKTVEFGRRRVVKVRGLSSKVVVYPVKSADVRSPATRTPSAKRPLEPAP